MEIYTLMPSHIVFADPMSSGSKLRDIAQALEGLGLAGICAGDHIVHYGLEIDDHIRLQNCHPDIFTFLTAIAAATERVKIVSRILVVPYRQPFATAHAFASLDVISGGRAVMGVGVGYAAKEFDAFGIPFAERGPRTDEYLRLIRELWRHQKVDFNGQFYSSNSMGLLMRPVQKGGPPIWIGAHNPRAIDRAVELGDAWTPNCYAYPFEGKDRFGLSLDEYVFERERLDGKRAASGLPPLQCILSAGPVLDIRNQAVHPGRDVDTIQRFTGCGNIDEVRQEFEIFNRTRPDGFYVTFSGDTVEDYMRNAEIFMSEIAPQL